MNNTSAAAATIHAAFRAPARSRATASSPRSRGPTSLPANCAASTSGRSAALPVSPARTAERPSDASAAARSRAGPLAPRTPMRALGPPMLSTIIAALDAPARKRRTPDRRPPSNCSRSVRSSCAIERIRPLLRQHGPDRERRGCPRRLGRHDRVDRPSRLLGRAADGGDQARRRGSGDHGHGRAARTSRGQRHADHLRAARLHEVARRVAREHSLELVRSKRRELETANLGERRHQRDDERPVLRADGAGASERARQLGEGNRQRRPSVGFARRLERHAPRAVAGREDPDGRPCRLVRRDRDHDALCAARAAVGARLVHHARVTISWS